MNLFPHRARWMAMSAKAGLKSFIATRRYRFSHWFFQWVLDHEGDIGLLVANTLLLVKYKEHTALYWNNPFKPSKYRPAPKYVGNDTPTMRFDPVAGMVSFYNAGTTFNRILKSAVDEAEAQSFSMVTSQLVWKGFKDVSIDVVSDAGRGLIVAVFVKGDQDSIDRTVAELLALFLYCNSDGEYRGMTEGVYGHLKELQSV